MPRMLEARRVTGFLGEKAVALGRLFLGIEVTVFGLFRGSFLNAVELQNRSHTHLPNALLGAGLLVHALATAQLAVNGQMRALRQRLCVVGELAPHDAAMPLGGALVLAALLVLVGALGGKREHGEAGIVGGVRGGVLAEESDERNSVLIHREVSWFRFPA